MPMEIFLILMLVFGCIFLSVTGISYFVNTWMERRKISEKMSGEASEKKLPLKSMFLKLADHIGHFFSPKSAEELSGMRKKLLIAGYRNRYSAKIVYGAKALICMLVPFGLFMIKLAFNIPMKSTLLIAILISAALIGFYAPDVFLRLRIADRKQKILKGFPDALDLLIVCVEAGMSLDSAITRVGEELKLSNKVLSDELKYLKLELRAGKSRRDALKNFGFRTDLEEVMSLMTLLIQTDRFGTSIAQALRVYSETMRTQRYQRAEEMAAKLPVKLVLPLILCIFPSLFVVILGPAIIQAVRVLGSR